MGPDVPGIRSLEVMTREDGEIGQDVRELGLGARERDPDGERVFALHPPHLAQFPGPRVRGGGIQRGAERPDHVVRRRGHAVVPPHVLPQREAELVTTRVPGPACQPRDRRERAVVGGEGQEQDVLLHLLRHGVDGHERIDGLEVGAGRHQDRRGSLGGLGPTPRQGGAREHPPGPGPRP